MKPRHAQDASNAGPGSDASGTVSSARVGVMCQACLSRQGRPSLHQQNARALGCIATFEVLADSIGGGSRAARLPRGLQFAGARVAAALSRSLVITFFWRARDAFTRRATLDSDTSGPQKFHLTPVPRVGGIGIFAGLALSLVAIGGSIARRCCCRPGSCCVGCRRSPGPDRGLHEEGSRRRSACWPRRPCRPPPRGCGLGAMIPSHGYPGAGLARCPQPSARLLLTVFAVAGIANSVNIIDGFNGLASMCVVIMLAAMAYVAFQVGDQVVGALALAGIGRGHGLLHLELPGRADLPRRRWRLLPRLLRRRGLDPAAACATRRVSPLFPLLACIYPVFETLFSIYRRRFLRAGRRACPTASTCIRSSIAGCCVGRWATAARAH